MLWRLPGRDARTGPSRQRACHHGGVEPPRVTGGGRTVRLRPRPFPTPLGVRLRASLAVAHASEPFSPVAAREAARRVAQVADSLGLDPTLFRGGLDIGGVELDTVWVVVEERVVDAALPLLAPRFVDSLRDYVTGHIDDDDLDRAAHPYSVQWRVIGAYPDRCRYVGAPVWMSRRLWGRRRAGH